MEDALLDMPALRQFAGLSSQASIPDETTILNFRHLIEEHDLADDILACVNGHLVRKGLMIKRGTMVDATIIDAPASTKNAIGERPGDASDEEGQGVVFRHEGAYRF